MATERRYVTGEVELRSQGSSSVIEGYAAVFNSRSKDLGGFKEVINPGAFTKTVKEADVRAFFNHDKNLILGRTKAGTLRVAEDSKGVHYSVDVPNTTYARDLAASIERGDVNQSSFAFSVVGPKGEDWGYTEDNYPLRSLNEVRLYDVSPVTVPAYEDTTSGMSQRSVAALCELRGIDFAAVADMPVADAMNVLLNGADLRTVVNVEVTVDDAADAAVDSAEPCDTCGCTPGVNTCPDCGTPQPMPMDAAPARASYDTLEKRLAILARPTWLS